MSGGSGARSPWQPRYGTRNWAAPAQACAQGEPDQPGVTIAGRSFGWMPCPGQVPEPTIVQPWRGIDRWRLRSRIARHGHPDQKRLGTRVRHVLRSPGRRASMRPGGDQPRSRPVRHVRAHASDDVGCVRASVGRARSSEGCCRYLTDHAGGLASSPGADDSVGS